MAGLSWTSRQPLGDRLDHFAFWRIAGWLRGRHLKLNWGTLHRRFLPGWEVRDGGTELFRPRAVTVTRYRHRGTRIPTPGRTSRQDHPHRQHVPVGSRMRREPHVPFGERAEETDRSKGRHRASARSLPVCLDARGTRSDRPQQRQNVVHEPARAIEAIERAAAAHEGDGAE